MVEMDYSLANRSIERNGVLDVARQNNIDVLAFGVLSHGLPSDSTAKAFSKGGAHGHGPGLPSGFHEVLVGGLRKIAEEKNTTVEKLAQAYVYAKNPDMSILIGTTRKEHLQDSIDALSLDLTPEDVRRIEKAFPAEKLQGMHMRNIVFRDGQIISR